MPKILCTLPNASDEISGVKFSPREDAPGVVSEDVTQDVADGFLSIPGYELIADTAAADKAAADAEKADLVARAAAIDFKIKANWSVERLKAEVESAEKAAAEAAAAKTE